MLDPNLAAMMPHTITVAPKTGSDAWGGRTYGTTITYTGLIQHKRRMVRNAAGEELVSNITIHLATTTAIGPEDRITLPSGYLPLQPEIIMVGRISDEDGMHHTVVYC